MLKTNFGSWEFLVDKTNSIRTVNQLNKHKKCTTVIRNQESAIKQVRLKKQKDIQYLSNLLHCTCKNLHQNTKLKRRFPIWGTIIQAD